MASLQTVAIVGLLLVVAARRDGARPVVIGSATLVLGLAIAALSLDCDQQIWVRVGQAGLGTVAVSAGVLRLANGRRLPRRPRGE